jgi:hypothetical protein
MRMETKIFLVIRNGGLTRLSPKLLSHDNPSSYDYQVGCMNIKNKLEEILMKPISTAYECWMCGQTHRDPVEYLWHINAHKE